MGPALPIFKLLVNEGAKPIKSHPGPACTATDHDASCTYEHADGEPRLFKLFLNVQPSRISRRSLLAAERVSTFPPRHGETSSHHSPTQKKKLR
jgi:hypothetical protein